MATPSKRVRPATPTSAASYELVPASWGIDLGTSPGQTIMEWTAPTSSAHAFSNGILRDDCSDGDCREYRIIKRIGTGSYAECLKVIESHTENVWAAKVLPKRKLSTAQTRRMRNLNMETKIGLLDVKEEIAIHRSLYHPGIVGMKSVFCDSQTGKLVFILEYCCHGTLRQVLGRCPNRRLPTAAAQRWGAQLLAALDYLHTAPVLVAHRDLNPDNLLIDDVLNLRVADFGLAVHVDESGIVPGEVVQNSVGTVNYIAPEVILRRSACDLRQADIWSAGVTLYEMMLGKVPFVLDQQSTNEDSYDGLVQPVLDAISADLIGAMLTRDPRQRPSSGLLARHAFFVAHSVGETCGCSPLSTGASPTNHLSVQDQHMNQLRLMNRNSTNLGTDEGGVLVPLQTLTSEAQSDSMLLATQQSNVVACPLRLDMSDRTWAHTLGSIQPHGDLQWVQAATVWASSIDPALLQKRRHRRGSWIATGENEEAEEQQQPAEEQQQQQQQAEEEEQQQEEELWEGETGVEEPPEACTKISFLRPQFASSGQTEMTPREPFLCGNLK